VGSKIYIGKFCLVFMLLFVCANLVAHVNESYLFSNSSNVGKPLPTLKFANLEIYALAQVSNDNDTKLDQEFNDDFSPAVAIIYLGLVLMAVFAAVLIFMAMLFAFISISIIANSAIVALLDRNPSRGMKFAFYQFIILFTVGFSILMGFTVNHFLNLHMNNSFIIIFGSIVGLISAVFFIIAMLFVYGKLKVILNTKLDNYKSIINQL